MDLSSCTAIVLAAGKGTRMRSRHPKVLHRILDWPLIFYPLKLLCACKVGRIIVVLGHEGHLVKEAIQGFHVEVVWQKRQLGTGHAVGCAMEKLGGQRTHCLIMCGDMPLMTKETIEAFFSAHISNKAHLSVLSAVFEDPSGYGRIVRGADGNLLEIVEEKDASPEIKAIGEVNTGTYLVDSMALGELLAKVKNDNAQGEYYLTDIISIAQSQGMVVGAYTMKDPREALGVNSRFDLARAERMVLDRLRQRHMENGVTLVMPETIYIDNGVTIENDVVIGPFCMIKGMTTIGSGATIGAYSLIEDCVIDDGEVIPPYSRLCKEEI